MTMSKIRIEIYRKIRKDNKNLVGNETTDLSLIKGSNFKIRRGQI